MVSIKEDGKSPKPDKIRDFFKQQQAEYKANLVLAPLPETQREKAIRLSQLEEEIVDAAYELEKNWPPKHPNSGVTFDISEVAGRVVVTASGMFDEFPKENGLVIKFSKPGEAAAKSRVATDIDLSIVLQHGVRSSRAYVISRRGEHRMYGPSMNNAEPSISIDGEPYTLSAMGDGDFTRIENGLGIIKAKIETALGKTPISEAAAE